MRLQIGSVGRKRRPIMLSAMRSGVRVLGFVAMLTASAATAQAQCGEWDNRFGNPPGVGGVTNAIVETLTTWDPDGDGPFPALLVAGGRFTTAGGVTVNRIARWDGSAWLPFGSGMDLTVLALTTWDPDGDGPLAAQLVAGGSFATAGGVTVNNIARWDGSAWQPLATGTSGSVRSLTVWDPDGDGPLPAQLVAGGDFTTAGGVTVNSIARWDGSAWHAFGSGMDDGVLALTTWDPDGDGPLAAELVAGGDFTTAGGVTVNRIARWDGSEWHPFGSGMNFTLRALTTWDPDGDGPLPVHLVAGGNFTTAGGVTVNYIARWDGSAWQPFGSGLDSTVRALAMWDPDGDGPLAAELVAVSPFFLQGQSVNYIARWDGSEWNSFFELSIVTGDSVFSLTTWDPDGDGPLPIQLVAGGRFTTASGVTLNNVARWDGSVAWPIGSGMNSSVLSLTTWDPDGDGPLPAQPVAGGNFNAAGGVAANYIARWDGSAWQALGSGTNGTVWSLTTWDPDGDGPLAALLVAGGSFTTAGGVTVNSIARWDGSAWHAFGSGVSGGVRSLTTWDPDGDGPLSAQLVVGGSFTTAGGENVNNIAVWNGAAWQALGSGTNGTVWSLTTWDPDGDGPLSPQLLAGGQFTTAGGETVNNIAVWNGSAWQALGTGTSGTVRSLATWDPDGEGPLAAQLVAGGIFVTADGVTVNSIARWDGAAWQSLGSGTTLPVFSLTIWDPDGDGALGPQLVAGGGFTTAGGVTVNRIARWDGSAWQPFGSGLPTAAVWSLTTWDFDGGGPRAAQLVAGGSFTSAGGIPAGHIALWSTLSPEITVQPTDDSLSPGATAVLTLTARNGQPVYQWRKGELDLVDGPTDVGSVISGANTASLTITNAQLTDSGNYDCIVTNSCGQVISGQAILTVTPPTSCGGDANGDNQVDGADLSVLLFLFGQSVTPGTAADFNGDGVVNGADLSVLLFRFGAAC